MWDRSCASTSRTGSFAHYYRFNLPQQIGVQIDLEASANSYLYLLRGAEVGGEVIASNDDAASGTSNSQIFVLLEAGEYTIEATTQERGTTGEFRVTLVPVREHVSFAPAQCPPEPVPAPGAQAIDTLSLNNTDGPELANSYLSACLEGAWRQMESLGSRGLLHPVGIAVIDSGLYEPPDTDSYRNLVVQNEFDWERISVRDTVQDRVFETEDDRFRRSHHGTAVASILAAVNQGGHSGLAKSGGGYDPSFSGVVGSVPSLDYELHFYEAQKSGETKELDFGAIERALEDIEALGDRIDVVNLSQGLVCDNNDNPAAFLLCRYRVFGAPTNRNDRYKGLIERMPEVIFVAGAGNSGSDALFSTPARLSLELPNVITVGAVETNDGTGEANRWVDDQTKASNYGTPITIAAQGAQLYALTTTSPVEAYRRDSGTSFAAPLVSGVAAFLRAIDPDIAAREVVEILGESSTPIPVCTVNDPDIAMENCPEEQREHWRLLNADAAVKELLKRRGIVEESSGPTKGLEQTTTSESNGTREFASVSAGGAHTCGVRVDGSVACWGRDSEYGLLSPPEGEFASVSAGDWHTCGVRVDGSVACWGSNLSALLEFGGQATPPEGKFTSVSAGDLHTCGLKANGSIACWGMAQYGQTTSPEGLFTSISVGGTHNCAVRTDGTVACWGSDEYGQLTPPEGEFALVSAGGYHTCGVRGDGSVVCWGQDSFGLTMPPGGEFASVSAGGGHTCGVKTDGTVECWGWDRYGATKAPDGEFTSVSGRGYHTCGVRVDGSVACWGRNQFGEATPPRVEFASVSAGRNHACGVRVDGSVACWGHDGQGRSTPPEGEFVSVSAGQAHTCGVRVDGSVACWGDDRDGKTRPPAGEFASVSVGPGHTCGLRLDGSVVCWGSNYAGQATPLEGEFASVSVGGNHTCGVRLEGSVECWGLNDYGQATPPEGRFTFLSAGAFQTCGVKEDGSVVCWASDLTPPEGEFASVSAARYHACGVRLDGSVACWGDDGDGESTPPEGVFLSVSAGHEHTCGVRLDGSVVCWGDKPVIILVR